MARIRIETYVDESLSDQLDSLCKETGVKRATLLREILDDFLTSEVSNNQE